MSRAVGLLAAGLRRASAATNPKQALKSSVSGSGAKANGGSSSKAKANSGRPEAPAWASNGPEAKQARQEFRQLREQWRQQQQAQRAAGQQQQQQQGGDSDEGQGDSDVDDELAGAELQLGPDASITYHDRWRARLAK